MKKEKSASWKKYPPYFLDKGSNCFWQKLLFRKEIPHDEDMKFFAEITEWEMNNNKSYQVKMQIHEDTNITKKTINITIFSYDKLDFKKMEKDARSIIKKLTNK